MIRLLIFYFIFQFQFSYCQEREASLIFYDNTKVKGLGEIKNNIIYFRLSNTEKPEKWDYDIAKGLDFDGMGYHERYEYIITDTYKKPYLMEVIEEGFINLYRDVSVINSSSGFGMTRNTVSLIQNSYYIKKQNEDKAFELSFNFKKKVEKLFGDCKALMEKINKKEFTSKNTLDIVHFYNDYCGEYEEED